MIISSNRYSIPCSFSFPSGNPIMKMFVLHIVPSVPSIILFFYFAALRRWFFATLLSKFLIQSPASSNVLFIPSSVFFILDIAFFVTNWFIFMVFMSYFMLDISVEVLIKFLENPYNHILNSISCKLLASISFSTFSKDFSFYFIWGTYKVASFCLSVCIRLICYDSHSW